MSMGNSGNTTTTSNAEVSNLLVQGFKAAKEGRRDEAYEVFCDVVRRDPNNELGWLYRAATTEDLSEAFVCLQRVLSINPANEKAQRGVERIQNRLSAESNRTATAAGVASADLNGAGATSPSIEEKDVISGFNPGFSRVAASSEPSNQPPSRYAYQEAPSPFNQASAPQAEESNATPPPYRPDFGQLNGGDTAVKSQPASDRPEFAFQPGRVKPTSANTGYSSPNGATENEQDNEEMVDEPVYPPVAASGRIGSQREATNARRAGIVGGLASARQRGRAAFGTETPTGLDQNGQRRSQKILVPLLILGVILVIAALLLLLIPALNKQVTPDATSQAVAPATSTLGSLTSATGNSAPATPTGAPAVTVPVVGVTTSSATSQTTARATTAANATTAAPATTARPATTAAAVSATNPPPAATTAAPPAPTTAPPPAAETAVPVSSALPRATIYVIKSGDNLTRIASQYSTSIAAIAAANPTVAINNIFAGNRLVIPVSRPDFKGKGGAILAANETLQTLADRYKVSLDELARFNGLTNPSDAKPGDAILVP